jgi:GNAT superfamily N-acetyltransferase
MCFYASISSNEDDATYNYEDVLSKPTPKSYVEGWKREDDMGLVAVVGDEKVGAAWYRALSEPILARNGIELGNIPENMICLGVEKDWRRQGVGRALMLGLLDKAREHLAEIALTTDRGSPAQRLYEQIGFQQIGHDATSDKGFIIMKITL